MIVLLAGLLVSLPSLALTQVTASVDKNPVTVKESIVLTVIADDDIDTSALDTSVLLADFIVGRTSVSSHTSMVNFQTSRTTKWTTLLIPRREGDIVIPALKVDGKETAPIKITVLSAEDPNAQTQQDIFITAEVSNKDVYVQQMFTLTVKLHFAAELKRGSLSEPVFEGATVSQIGKDDESDEIINGRRFRVIKRTYSIAPQQSGNLMLVSPMFSGEVMVQSTRRSNFLSFGETKPISVIGEEIPITVRPIPAQFQGQWLPSELLTLHEEWQPAPEAFKVGEPITRTITLTAEGISSEQIPAIEFDLPKGLKVYPDQPELHSSLNNGRLISQSVRNFAIVASHEGDFEIPEIKLPWWNTVTNKMEIAVLPAQRINVFPNDNLPSHVTESTPYVDKGSPVEPAQTIIVEKTPWLQWLFLGLWLVTSLAWLLQTLVNKRKTAPKKTTQQRVNDVHLAMLAACKKNDGKAVINLMLPWLQRLNPSQSINSIDDAKAAFQDDAFTEAVDDLYSHFYGANADKGAWNSQKMIAAITSIYKKKSPNDTPAALSLNP